MSSASQNVFSFKFPKVGLNLNIVPLDIIYIEHDTPEVNQFIGFLVGTEGKMTMKKNSFTFSLKRKRKNSFSPCFLFFVFFKAHPWYNHGYI